MFVPLWKHNKSFTQTIRIAKKVLIVRAVTVQFATWAFYWCNFPFATVRIFHILASLMGRIEGCHVWTNICSNYYILRAIAGQANGTMSPVRPKLASVFPGNILEKTVGNATASKNKDRHGAFHAGDFFFLDATKHEVGGLFLR